MRVILIFFFWCFCTMMSQVTSSYALHRQLLHQPFFPLDNPSPFHSAYPPSLPPQPSHQQPRYPFSSSSSSSTPANGHPFFPSDPSPPPPPASSHASFPANFSSLIFPNSSDDTHIPTTLITTIVSISVSALLLVLLLVLILRRNLENSVASHKPLRSESMEHLPPPTVMSDGTIRPPPLRGGRGMIGTSTEFLYLGTVVNSQEIHQSNSIPNNVTKDVLCKPDSPEVRPLPPLPKFNCYSSGEQASFSRNVEDEDDEEFFLPRGSSGRKESLGRTESVSSKALRRVEVQIFSDRSRSFNSK